MFNRCLAVFFPCSKSKKTGVAQSVPQSCKALLEQKAETSQPGLALLSKKIASDVQVYLAQKNVSGTASKGKGAVYLAAKKTVPELISEMRKKYKVYEHKCAEFRRLQSDAPDYQIVETALKLEETACFEAEKAVLEAMRNHAEYEACFKEDDGPVPQFKL